MITALISISQRTMIFHRLRGMKQNQGFNQSPPPHPRFSLSDSCQIPQAVVPLPDGGYPGLNTAEGQNALSGLTTGIGNAAVGWFSLFSNTDGSFNTAVGAGTLLFNVGNQASGEEAQNTAIRTASLLNNATGASNTATATTALLNNTTGNDNVAGGVRALFSNITGSNNIAIGAALPKQHEWQLQYRSWCCLWWRNHQRV